MAKKSAAPSAEVNSTQKAAPEAVEPQIDKQEQSSDPTPKPPTADDQPSSAQSVPATSEPELEQTEGAADSQESGSPADSQPQLPPSVAQGAVAEEAVTIDTIFADLAKERHDVDGRVDRRPMPRLNGRQARTQAQLYRALRARNVRGINRQQDVFGWILDQAADAIGDEREFEDANAKQSGDAETSSPPAMVAQDASNPSGEAIGAAGDSASR